MSLIRKILTNPIWLILVYLVSLTGIFAVGTFWGIRRIPDSTQYVQDRLVPVYQGHPVDQAFVVNHSGLNVVMIYLRNASVKNADPFIFNLLNSSGQTVRTINLTGYNIGDGTNVRFQFPPLPDSQNQTYTIYLTAPDTIPGQSKIEVGFSNADTYPAGSSSVTSGDMTFQTYYRPQNRLVLLRELGNLYFHKLIHKSFLISGVLYLILSLIILKTFTLSSNGHISLKRI